MLLCISSLLLFGCQYQCSQLPGKNCLRNDLLYVEWDVISKLLNVAVVNNVVIL